MMKRWAWVPLVVAMSVLAGCPAPPPYWQGPRVESMSMSSGTVVAGEPFTVSVTATDDNRVDRLFLRFALPGSQSYTEVVDCDGGFDPGPVVTVDFVCSLPDFAPNGSWLVDAYVFDAEFIPSHARPLRQLAFEVTGGSDDVSGPVRELAVIAPDPVPAGSSFIATFQVSDEHLGDYDEALTLHVSGPFHESVCVQTSSIRLSPTVHEWVFQCAIPADATPGGYTTVALIKDAIGHPGQLRADFDVVAPETSDARG